MQNVRLKGAGVELAADVYGHVTDPAVLLLHGGGQTRHAWGKAGEAIAAAGRCAVSIDLRGHGDSDWSPDGRYPIDAFAADVTAVCLSLATVPVLVGASLGGLASLLAVAEAEETIASALVLVDVAPRVEEEGASRIRAFMRETMAGFDGLEDAADAIARYTPHRERPTDLSGLAKVLRQGEDNRWYWHWDPQFMADADGTDGRHRMIDHERLRAGARRVTIPTLLIRGVASEIVSDESVQELRELMPHAGVVDIGGAGHMVAGDRNDIFNRSVLEFIDHTNRI